MFDLGMQMLIECARTDAESIQCTVDLDLLALQSRIRFDHTPRCVDVDWAIQFCCAKSIAYVYMVKNP